MSRVLIAITAAYFTAISTAVSGIPEPDTVLYGTIRIAGDAISASDEAIVRARELESGRLVGSYVMGANPVAGDHYVLRVRTEYAAAGTPVGPDATKVGARLRITVERNNSPESEVGALILSDRGLLLDWDLPFIPDVDGNKKVDLRDFARFQNCLGREASAGNCSAADLNRSREVDIDDYFTLASGWE